MVPKVHKSRTETSKWRTILAGWEVPCGRVINILTMGDFRRSKTLLMEEDNHQLVVYESVP